MNLALGILVGLLMTITVALMVPGWPWWEEYGRIPAAGAGLATLLVVELAVGRG